MSSISLAARGRNFTRAVMLRAADVSDPQAVANAQWGPAQADAIVRAAVTPMSADDVGTTPAVAEFMQLVRDQSIYGRLAGLRKVPFNVPAPRIVSGSTGHWVGEAKPKPLSKPAVMGSTLKARKVVSMLAMSAEAVRFGNPGAEQAFQADLTRAVVGAWDQAFIDPANAGETEVRPAAITNGVTPITATADPAKDLELLFAAFGGDFAAAYLVMDPMTAIHLAKRRTGSAYEFPDLGPRGGSVLGIPVLTSRNVPAGVIALVDPTGITANDEGLQVARATQALLLMADDPDDPDTQGELVSLYQSNLVALRAEIYTSWEVQRPGSVAVLTGADAGWGE